MSRTFQLNPKVADEVHKDYCRVLKELELDGSPETQYLTGTSPSIEHISSLIQEVFSASFVRIEVRHHRFCIAVCPEESVDERFLFKEDVPFDSDRLAKLSPALQAEQITIGVWPVLDNLRIWGFWPERMSDSSWSRRPGATHRLLLTVVDSGQILVEFDAFPGAEFVRKLINGTQAEDIELSANCLLNALYSVLGSDDEELDRLSAFRDIAIHMRSHGHGGTLLIVRSDNKTWQESIDFGANTIRPYQRPEKHQ